MAWLKCRPNEQKQQQQKIIQHKMSKEKNISKKSTENNYLYIHAARETHKTDNKNGLNAENEQKKTRKKTN